MGALQFSPLLLCTILVLCSQPQSCNSEFIYNRSSSSSNSVSDKEPIYILTLVPYYNPEPSLNPSFHIGDDVQPAMELARLQINNNQFMLENYTLELIHSQGGCEFLTTTTTSFVEEAYKPGRHIAGIIGPSCSSSTVALSPITNRPEIGIVMVHGSGTPILANRTAYRYQLGPLGSTQVFVDKFRLLLNITNWKRVSILYDSSNVFYEDTQKLLIEQLADVKVAFLSEISFNFLPLDGVIQAQTPIVFVLASLELTQKVICSARNMNMVYSTYQWVYMENRLEELLVPVNSFICTGEDISNALENSFLIVFDLEESNDTLLVSNITFSEYCDAYNEMTEEYNRIVRPARNSTYSYWAGIFYDAVWAWGLVLDNLTKSTDSFDVVSDSYGNLRQSEIIVEQLYKTSFQGASGKINFDRETGFSQRRVDLYQIRSGSGELLLSTDFENTIIIDDTFQNQIIREHKAIGIFFGIIALLEVIIVIALQLATIVFRNEPSVKASSTKFLHISYSGIYVLSFVSIVRFLHNGLSLPVEWIDDICVLFWTWCLPVGFTLAFGPVAMRTWRVYRIFKHYLNPGPLINDYVLIGGIIIMLVVDLTLAIIWTSVDRFMLVYRMEDPNSPYIVQPICECKHILVWVVLIYFYKLSLLTIVTLLSLLTRNISNRSFTTTSQRILVYIFKSIFILGFVLFHIFLVAQADNPNYSSTILYFTLTMTLLVFMICIFIPPLLPIMKKYCPKNKSELTKALNKTNTMKLFLISLAFPKCIIIAS